MEPEVEEITVVAREEGEVLERSAQAVTVVETEAAARQSADLGEVVARTQGVGVRRSGGLGSDARFSLNGLTDDQVRFFLDGVPLELAGYPTGIANVPVGLVERVEIYRGVVPVRFGADALGGAVNLVSAVDEGTRASASYGGGSFDTHRLAGRLAVVDDGTGLFARGAGWLDASRNDYTVDVEVADEVGRLRPAEVRRFHDAYRAGGGTLEIGARDRGWAEHAAAALIASDTRQEIQHNVVMTVPYGEPVATVATRGGTLRYTNRWRGGWSLDALAGFTRTERAFVDTGACVYDWFGQCVRERAVPGEIATPATDQVVWDRAVLGRASAGFRPGLHHAFTLSVAPTAFDRTGDDRLREPGEGRDPLTARRDVVQVVSGLEHQLDAAADRVQNVAFVKRYDQHVASEEPVPGGGFRDDERTTGRFGLGDGLRVSLAPWLWTKASWEWATRLPTPEEIFGDAVLVIDNLALAPETSHNLNLGATVDAGDLRLDANGFLREAEDLIVLLGNDRTFSYFNVFGARSLGVEAAAGWTSPREWIALDVNGTWLELRNTSRRGTFGDFAGDRIPNRPWLFANGSLALGASDVAADGDRLTADLYTRYVHPFFRGWESVGLVEYKQVVPAQLSHTVAVTYVATSRGREVSASVEVQNLTDAVLYDFFGVQRPGRSVFGKVSFSR